MRDLASHTEAAAPQERRRYPFWVRALAVLVAFGFGGGVGASIIVALMVLASKGLIPWVN
ncbi:hypothetical protein ACFQI3_03380 [Hansschlegelia quercus]|uniref:Uncharacterized protein n=1 Tax=Hansschlegelia quercus TaxID=2528245 RepID=A0A4Q9GQ69_9HYPH|nr:hypothetical protein [Hansschlegelia quercus]TBN54944.1 hypothetical protein EYR15_01985 [Hansschlegelia quercus]